MKWIVKYFNFYCAGNEPSGDSEVIGYSDKTEQELFEVLEKEYPNLPIRKEVVRHNPGGWNGYDEFDKDGNKTSCLYQSYVYFVKNTLKEF